MLSLEQKVGQMMYVGFDGLVAPDYILDWLATGRIGGIYLFARNVESPQQLANLIRSCHDAAESPILVGIDQEGGLVARLREGFTESPGVMALAAANDLDLTERMSEVLAIEMKSLGINWVFAPVVDLVHDINNPSVSTRAASWDKRRVSEMALAQIRGFQRHIAATVKHFPGLGKSPIDTHLALATIDDSIDHIRQNDLMPFADAIQAGVASVMTTHTVFTALDDKHPATLSPVVLNTLLRGELGFQGLVSTDCLEMNAITDHYGPGESAVLSVLAGVDTVMFSHTRAYQEAAYESVLQAVRQGRISEELIDSANKRIARIKSQYPAETPHFLDIIRSEDHLAVAQRAARAGTVLLKGDQNLIPITHDEEGANIGLIEFASIFDSEVMEETGRTGFANMLSVELPKLRHIALTYEDLDDPAIAHAINIAKDASVLILATRSMHLIPEHQKVVDHLRGYFKNLILVCLRNPYDVSLIPEADAVICTCGDATPSMQAAVDALLGKFVPSGTLPVEVA